MAVFVCLGYMVLRLMISVSEIQSSSSDYGRDKKES